MWHQLEHENIVPFLCVETDPSVSTLAIVLEWMPNGDLHRFILSQPDVSDGCLFQMVRFESDPAMLQENSFWN